MMTLLERLEFIANETSNVIPEEIEQVCDLAAEKIRSLESALSLLVQDVQDYEAWQRPCHALDVAKAELLRQPQPGGEMK